jgi:hypothetical protein
MTDDPNLDDDIPMETDEAFDGDDAFDADEGMAMDTEAILAEAALDRLHRKAYWHSNQKQLFAFLFANCLFFASAFVAWYRATPGEAADPSLYIRGIDTIRGALIFALSLYGFWTAVFNIWHAQMKVWPYLLAAMLALWVGIGGFMSSIGGEQWEAAKAWKDSPEFGSKSMFDDMTVPLSTIAPGYWLLTFGGLIVVWVIINGLMQGSASAKAAAAEESQSSGRRRKR